VEARGSIGRHHGGDGSALVGGHIPLRFGPFLSAAKVNELLKGATEVTVSNVRCILLSRGCFVQIGTRGISCRVLSRES
jgi:hypothetical protein